MWIAVVYTKNSKRKDGSLACFVNERRAPAVTQAFQARREWQKKGYGPYDILIGRIEEQLELSGDGLFLISDKRRVKDIPVPKTPKRRIRISK